MALGIVLLLVAGPMAHAQGGSGRYDTGPLRYQVDPFWPNPLPNNWIMGQVGGLAIDKHDNIWVYQRPRSLDTSETGAVQQPQRSQCCVPAPSVIEFNQAGDVVNAWGGPDYIPGWPNSEHGILVDDQGYVWITGNGVGDRAAYKFTQDGKLVDQIGQEFSAATHRRRITRIPQFSVSQPSSQSTRKRTRSTSPMVISISASSCTIEIPSSSSAAGVRMAFR